MAIGPFAEIAWRSDGVLESANAPSAAQLGAGDTCCGGQGFPAHRAGEGVITAGLGSVLGIRGLKARTAGPIEQAR